MKRIYLDHQATTPMDPRVIAVVTRAMKELFGNPASRTHEFGTEARHAVEGARRTVASAIGARSADLIWTSGSTESNNLAIKGMADHPRRKGRHVVTVATEHHAVLDPLSRLERRGLEVTRLRPARQGRHDAGRIDPQQVADAIREDTLLVTVMWANNEIGVTQPMAEIGAICAERGVVLHTDATQAVGRLPCLVDALGVDLMSFSAHKLYGPKGIGALFVRRRHPAVRLAAQMDGGGHEFGLRSGTLNVPAIVGFAEAIQCCRQDLDGEQSRIRGLRNRLWHGLQARIPGLRLNGPSLDDPALRLAHNLNLEFPGVEGQSLMLRVPTLALSSGSACTSAEPHPSHVLKALGLTEDEARSSLRIGLGRGNTNEEADQTVDLLATAYQDLRPS